MLDKKKTKDFVFYFKSDAVIMEYHNQYVCFNNFSLRNKRSLAKFSNKLKQSRNVSLNSVFGYAREFDIPSLSLSDGAAIKHNIKRVN